MNKDEFRQKLHDIFPGHGIESIRFDKLEELYKERLDFDLKNIIGETLECEHPDEVNCRAENWLQERRNWIEEVDRLRKYINEIESTSS